MTHTHYGYRIDRSDHIIEVDDAWLTFAAGNDAAGLDRSHVVGRSIWDFVHGEATRHLYQLVFDSVRSRHRPVTLPFRCDSPDQRRYMELLVAPAEGGDLLLAGVLLRIEVRPAVALLSAHRRARSGIVTLCSWCKRVRLEDGSWAEVERAVEVMGLFDEAELPRISHGMCPDCANAVRSRL